ncbi:MAG: Lrp/AsnC family transcriptional regulator [Candidatus Dormiibacterota bacterium]
MADATEAEEAPEPAPRARPRRAVTLDATDLAVLDLLLRDARASQRRIGREVGMSAPAVGERIARLERAGVITGYRVVVDRAQIGFSLTAYVSVTWVDAARDPSRILQELRSFPEIEDASIVAGPMDVILRLRARDHEHLRELLYRIWGLPGVLRTETFLSLGDAEPKDIDAELLGVLRDELNSHGRPV